jgi:hypothetical protein
MKHLSISWESIVQDTAFSNTYQLIDSDIKATISILHLLADPINLISVLLFIVLEIMITLCRNYYP